VILELKGLNLKVKLKLKLKCFEDVRKAYVFRRVVFRRVVRRGFGERVIE
jgi:hypothetical protein